MQSHLLSVLSKAASCQSFARYKHCSVLSLANIKRLSPRISQTRLVRQKVSSHVICDHCFLSAICLNHPLPIPLPRLFSIFISFHYSPPPFRPPFFQTSRCFRVIFPTLFSESLPPRNHPFNYPSLDLPPYVLRPSILLSPSLPPYLLRSPYRLPRCDHFSLRGRFRSDYIVDCAS